LPPSKSKQNLKKPPIKLNPSKLKDLARRKLGNWKEWNTDDDDDDESMPQVAMPQVAPRNFVKKKKIPKRYGDVEDDDAVDRAARAKFLASGATAGMAARDANLTTSQMNSLKKMSNVSTGPSIRVRGGLMPGRIRARGGLLSGRINVRGGLKQGQIKVKGGLMPGRIQVKGGLKPGRISVRKDLFPIETSKSRINKSRGNIKDTPSHRKEALDLQRALANSYRLRPEPEPELIVKQPISRKRGRTKSVTLVKLAKDKSNEKRIRRTSE
jgi:hypothetical protein